MNTRRWYRYLQLLFTTALLFILSYAFVSAQGQTGSADQTDPEAVIRSFYEFANAGDTESQNALWADDATLTFVDGTVLEGKNEVLTFSPGHVRIVISILEVDGSTVRWTSRVAGVTYYLEAEVVDRKIQHMRFVDEPRSTPCRRSSARVIALPTPSHRCA